MKRLLQLLAALLLLAAQAHAQVLLSSGETAQLCRVHDGTDLWLIDGSGFGMVGDGSGPLTVDGTLAVTGTFWQATQPISAAALPLPAGAATSAAQLPDGHNVTVDNAAGAAAVNIQDGGNTITVDGTVTANAGTGTFTMAIEQTGANNAVDVLTMPTTTVTATDLDIRNLAAATDKIDVAQKGGVAVAAGPCEREVPLYVPISQTAGTQLITGTASERIYICSIAIVTATAQNIALVDGTGSVCATSPTGLLGGSTAATGQNFAANGGWVLPLSITGWAKTSTDADNVCLLQSGAGQVSGVVTYVSTPNI